MASIRSEYHRFLAHLTQRHVHDDAPAGAPGARSPAATGRGRCCTPGRSTRLAPLAIAHLAQMPVAYDGDARGPENGPALGRLHQLEVGPFRGFMRQETFDLSHDITLVYGANGTGKSSFAKPWKWRCSVRSAKRRPSGSTSGRTATTLACAATSRQSCRLRRRARRRPSSPTKLSIASASSRRTASTISPESPRGPRAISASSSPPCSAWTSSASSCAASTPRSIRT